MLLHEILHQSAGREPNSPALVQGGVTTTFERLADRSAQLAIALGSIAAPGARIAVVADNCAEWIECYYGIPMGGHVLTMINQRLAVDEQAAMIHAAQARVVLGAPDSLARLAAHQVLGLDVVVVEFGDAYERFLAHACGSVTRAGDPDALAWLLFTSGTTGSPKGVQLSHRNLLAGALSHSIARRVADDDVFLFPFPLCHVAGHSVISFHLRGRPVVLIPRYRTDEFIATVADNGVTSASLAPTMIHSLLEHLDAETADMLRTLRWIFYGSAPIAPSLLREAMARLPGVGFSQGYGMTELAGNAAYLSFDDHRTGLAERPELLSSAGRPGPLVEIRVLDEGGKECPCDHPGEIVVHGDQVHLGYWRDDEATQQATVVDHEGRRWFRTGDLGRIDGHGRLTIIDRLKDIVVTGGENVSSRQVEDIVQLCPGVQEAAVIGVPDPHWGEVVCVVVVARHGCALTAETVTSFVRTRLAGFKVPRSVVFVTALPRNHTGKVLKAELRALMMEDKLQHERDTVP
jgi:acyl-CoA synthetase (AMP-forming)/AMP-acid ligase II